MKTMRPKRNEMLREAATGSRPVGRALRSMVQDEAGVTSIEYALLGSLIAVAIVASVAQVGTEVLVLWTFVANAVSAAT